MCVRGRRGGGGWSPAMAPQYILRWKLSVEYKKVSSCPFNSTTFLVLSMGLTLLQTELGIKRRCKSRTSCSEAPPTTNAPGGARPLESPTTIPFGVSMNSRNFLLYKAKIRLSAQNAVAKANQSQLRARRYRLSLRTRARECIPTLTASCALWVT